VRCTICKKFALEYSERAFQDYPCTVSDADQELTIRLQQGEIEMREGEETQQTRERVHGRASARRQTRPHIVLPSKTK